MKPFLTIKLLQALALAVQFSCRHFVPLKDKTLAKQIE
jgi:hypothetical protein